MRTHEYEYEQFIDELDRCRNKDEWITVYFTWFPGAGREQVDFAYRLYQEMKLLRAVRILLEKGAGQ